MRQAFTLARKAIGRTSPNPMVGAVIVKNGQVIGRGYHARAGEPHAEIVALREAGEEARNSTVYVNLEPCCHYGRTGPCTEAILEAGVRKVVVAMKDPNPLVAGKGIKRLRDGGIEVITGILADEAARLNEVFLKYITTGLPFVVVKTAMSLDGKIATATGESQWITGPQARIKVHEMRNMYDAILVGIGTVLADNPSLTCRLPGGGGRDPVRVVLDSKCRIPPHSLLLSQKSPSPAIVAAAEGAQQKRIDKIKEMGAEVLLLKSDSAGVDLKQLLYELASRKITSILVEGGAKVAASFFRNKLVDKICWFISPKIIGGHLSPGPVGGEGVTKLNDAYDINLVKFNKVGEDLYLEGYLKEDRGR